MTEYEIIGSVSDPVVDKGNIIINNFEIPVGVSGWYLDNVIADINDSGAKKIRAEATKDNKIKIIFSFKDDCELIIKDTPVLEKLGLSSCKKLLKKDIKKYFIISQPKAGTYLCSNLLINFELHATGMHVKGPLYRTYDPTKSLPNFKNKTELKKFIQSVTTRENTFGDVLNKIPQNGFAVGHLAPTPKNIICLADFKKILLVRNFEDHQQSLTRFKNEMNGSTSVNKIAYQKILDWKKETNVFVMTFDDMINCNVKKINALQKFLFNEVKFNSYEMINKALKSPSPTKSSIR